MWIGSALRCVQVDMPKDSQKLLSTCSNTNPTPTPNGRIDGLTPWKKEGPNQSCELPDLHPLSPLLVGLAACGLELLLHAPACNGCHLRQHGSAVTCRPVQALLGAALAESFLEKGTIERSELFPGSEHGPLAKLESIRISAMSIVNQSGY